MPIIKLQGEAELRKKIHYEVDTSMEPIGVGGMGQVFKGYMVDERTGVTRPVAIKFMFDDLPANAYERARREASIQLHNDNLIEMLGFLEIQEPDGMGGVKKHYHVISELLEGVSLSDLLEGKTTDRYGQDVPFAVKLLAEYRNDSEHFARTVVMSVVSGLMALHDAGYIHRDIDPSNIMVTSSGNIKLIDFGIAKQMNALTTGDKSLTVAGKFMGKPEYAAPELALGDIQHQNQTTDIYAVGILLYQCITGHTPFEGPRHEILQKQIKDKVPLTAIKNKALRNIIATACDKKQELRYQSSAQMRVALEEMGGLKQAMTKQKKMLYGGVAGAIVLLLIIVVALLATDNSSELQEQARQAELAAQKADFEGKVNESLKTADQRLQAVMANEELDETPRAGALLDIYREYDTVLATIKADSLFNLPTTNVEQKKTEIRQMVVACCDSLRSQAEQMRILEQTEVAEKFEKDADSLLNIANALK